MPVDVPTQLAIADARISFFYPQIWRLEKYCWSNYGFYIQGLRTHSVLPVDGVLTAPDFPNLTAGGQPFGWGPFLDYFPPTMMTGLTVLTYQYISHHPGFIARFEMRLNEDVYQRQIAYGMYSDIEGHDWIIIEEDE